jgi:hypothetical protein
MGARTVLVFLFDIHFRVLDFIYFSYNAILSLVIDQLSFFFFFFFSTSLDSSRRHFIRRLMKWQLF